MTRQQLIERILFAVDGYRFREWSLIDAVCRIQELIEQNPGAVYTSEELDRDSM